MQTGGEEAGTLRILIVEDEPFLSMDLEFHLTTLGQEVVGIASDAEGSVRISVCGRAVEHYAAMALIKR